MSPVKKGQSFLLFWGIMTGLMEDLAAGRPTSRAAYECAILQQQQQYWSHAIGGCDASRWD